MEENEKQQFKNIIQEIVYSFFLESYDFNGIPLRNISEELGISYVESIDLVKELSIDGGISIQSSTNPHIIGFAHFSSENQCRVLEQAKSTSIREMKFGDVTIIHEDTEFPICVYPSPQYLEKHRDVSTFGNAVYTKKLALGAPRLNLVYFEIEVLDKYANDPRYEFRFDDYSGNIYCKYDKNEQLYVRSEDVIFLKSFGLGYDNSDNRLAVVPLTYLKNLSPENQVYWMSKESKNGGKVLPEYYENIIRGNFAFSYSIFSGFIGEQNCLNELSEHIFGRRLFNRSYQKEERPREFTFFFKPTRKNYLDFILLLDKMISDNINKDFFRGSIDLDELVPVENGVVERRPKGTLRLFEEWLLTQYTNADDALKFIFKVFKGIRKERQEPAHKITTNEYSKEYDKKQKQMIIDAYTAMMNLRLAFASHPLAKGFQVPDWLEHGKIKPF
jgi:hypothetical protein